MAQIADEADFDRYVRAVAFPKALLHPSIADDVWLDLARGQLDTAVFRPFEAVEVAVREAANFPDSDRQGPSCLIEGFSHQRHANKRLAQKANATRYRTSVLARLDPIKIPTLTER